MLFQSTLLMRGATTSGETMYDPTMISIHAPHARSDAIAENLQDPSLFQSTLLMRGATDVADAAWTMEKFQSTLLMRGATQRAQSG